MTEPTLEDKFRIEMSEFYEALAQKHGFTYESENLSECPYYVTGSEGNTWDCPGCANENCNIRGRQYEYGFGGYLKHNKWKTIIGFCYDDYDDILGITVTLALNFKYLGRVYPQEEENYNSNLKSAAEYHHEIEKLLGIEKILSKEFEISEIVLHFLLMYTHMFDGNKNDESVFHFGYQLPAKDAKDITELDKLLGVVAGYLSNLNYPKTKQEKKIK